MTLLRLLESVHGHLGVLAAAALLHPAILLRKGKPLSPRARLSIALTTAATVLAFASGLLIYGDYREHVKGGLIQASLRTALLFETKEHVAWAVVALTVGAGVAALAAPREAHGLRRGAASLFGVAAALCVLVVALGTWVAAHAGFAD